MLDWLPTHVRAALIYTTETFAAELIQRRSFLSPKDWRKGPTTAFSFAFRKGELLSMRVK
jgi:hypothetical protein